MRELTVLTGASRGLGLALARRLVGRGGRLLCLSRGTAAGLEAEQWSLDLAEPAGAAERLRGWLRGLDGSGFDTATLINNAGVLAAVRPLRDGEAGDLARALRVGLEAPVLLTAAFLDATRGWPGRLRVLNVSSGLGRRPMASQAAYCAAKAGMDHFSRCLALEEAGRVRVCSLAPGVVDTDMQAAMRAPAPEDFPDRGRFLDLQARGLLTDPDACAAAVLAWLDRPDFGDPPVADLRG